MAEGVTVVAGIPIPSTSPVFLATVASRPGRGALRMIRWRPNLSGDASPIYEQIVVGLERDIRAGTLPPDTRLPTHRDLALELGVGVGTVTRAYAEAEARGLVTARVGRGSFVSPATGAQSSGSGEPINLSHNFPPRGPGPRGLATP
jgi:DNA-binding transcriptional regulator YhcF (GntR family)